MVLPQPDSPTIPRVSPSRMKKLTPSTALVTPLRLKKYVCRSFTSKVRRFLASKIAHDGPWIRFRASLATAPQHIYLSRSKI